jgi:hypothetical protein
MLDVGSHWLVHRERSALQVMTEERIFTLKLIALAPHQYPWNSSLGAFPFLSNVAGL